MSKLTTVGRAIDDFATVTFVGSGRKDGQPHASPCVSARFKTRAAAIKFAELCGAGTVRCRNQRGKDWFYVAIYGASAAVVCKQALQDGVTRRKEHCQLVVAYQELRESMEYKFLDDDQAAHRVELIMRMALLNKTRTRTSPVLVEQARSAVHKERTQVAEKLGQVRWNVGKPRTLHDLEAEARAKYDVLRSKPEQVRTELAPDTLVEPIDPELEARMEENRRRNLERIRRARENAAPSVAEEERLWREEQEALKAGRSTEDQE